MENPMMSKYYILDEKIASMRDIRSQLDSKLNSKTDLNTKLSSIRTDSNERLYSAVLEQNYKASLRNKELLKYLNSIDSLVPFQEKCKQSTVNLLKAKETYSKAIETMQPYQHRQKTIQLEDKIKQIQQEKVQASLRKDLLSREINREEQARQQLERERRELIMIHASEHFEMMETNARSAVFVNESRAVDKSIDFQINEASHYVTQSLVNKHNNVNKPHIGSLVALPSTVANVSNTTDKCDNSQQQLPQQQQEEEVLESLSRPDIAVEQHTIVSTVNSAAQPTMYEDVDNGRLSVINNSFGIDRKEPVSQGPPVDNVNKGNPAVNDVTNRGDEIDVECTYQSSPGEIQRVSTSIEVASVQVANEKNGVDLPLSVPMAAMDHRSSAVGLTAAVEASHDVVKTENSAVFSQQPPRNVDAALCDLRDSVKDLKHLIVCFRRISVLIEQRVAFIDQLCKVYSVDSFNSSCTSITQIDQMLNIVSMLLKDEDGVRTNTDNNSSLESFTQDENLLGDMALFLMQAASGRLLPPEAFTGVVTLDKLRKQHKKDPQPAQVATLWTLLTQHMRKVLEADSEWCSQLVSCYASALISHVPQDDQERFARKLSSMLTTIMTTSDEDKSPQPQSSAARNNSVRVVTQSTDNDHTYNTTTTQPVQRYVSYDTIQLPVSKASEFDDEELLADDVIAGPPPLKIIDNDVTDNSNHTRPNAVKKIVVSNKVSVAQDNNDEFDF